MKYLSVILVLFVTVVAVQAQNSLPSGSEAMSSLRALRLGLTELGWMVIAVCLVLGTILMAVLKKAEWVLWVFGSGAMLGLGMALLGWVQSIVGSGS